jgi:hypothetical protein
MKPFGLGKEENMARHTTRPQPTPHIDLTGRHPRVHRGYRWNQNYKKGKKSSENVSCDTQNSSRSGKEDGKESTGLTQKPT